MYLAICWAVGLLSVAGAALLTASSATLVSSSGRQSLTSDILSWSYDRLKKSQLLYADQLVEWNEAFLSSPRADTTFHPQYGRDAALNRTLVEIGALGQVYNRQQGSLAGQEKRAAMIRLSKRLVAALPSAKDPIGDLHAVYEQQRGASLTQGGSRAASQGSPSLRRLGLVRETASLLTQSMHSALASPHDTPSRLSGEPAVSLLLETSSLVSADAVVPPLNPRMFVRSLSSQQLVQETATQLETMLLEVHTATSSLLEAGVHSKEIFACVVDTIMNMAPEMILQLIINGIRTPLVDLFASIMASILPDILVPNSGQVPISSLHGEPTVSGPPAPPCVCKAGDGSFYSPITGITGGDPAYATTDGDEDPLFLTLHDKGLQAVDSSLFSEHPRAQALLRDLDTVLGAASEDWATHGNDAAFLEYKQGNHAGSRSDHGAGNAGLMFQGGRVTQELVLSCPCRSGHLGYRYYPAHAATDGQDMRFSTSGAQSKVSTQVQIMQQAQLRQDSAADAFSKSSSWIFHSQYDAEGEEAGLSGQAGKGKKGSKGGGKAGPIGKMEPKLREEIDAGMRGSALPRTYQAAAQALHRRLSDEVPLAAHQLSSRLIIGPMTKRLTLTLYRRLMARLAKPLVLALSRQLHGSITDALVKPLSLSLVHSLTHDPKGDVMCALCKEAASPGSSPLRLNETLAGLETVDQHTLVGPEEYLRGPYCQTCRRIRRHDRLVNEHVGRLIDAASTAAISREAEARIPAYVRDALRRTTEVYSPAKQGKKNKKAAGR